MSATEDQPLKGSPPPPASPWEQLKNAASQGDIATIKSLLKAKVLPNPDVPGETTPLMLAAYNGHTKVIPLLIQASANIHASSGDNGWTALMHAAANNKTRVIKVLVEARASLDHRGGDGNTALIVAALKGYNATVKLLVDAGANVAVADNSGRRALSWAVSENHLDVVKTLVKAEASLAAGSISDQEDPLTLAARKNAIQIARVLIRGQRGLDPNNVAKSAMMTAATEGSVDMMKFLLEVKAPLYPKTAYGNSLTGLAAEHGHWNIIQFLLDLNAERKIFDFNQFTTCMTAVRHGHLTPAYNLSGFDYGNDRDWPEDVHEIRMCAIEEAAAKGHAHILRELIDIGTIIDVDDTYDWDKAMLDAAEGGHLEAVKVLVDTRGYRADIDCRDVVDTPIIEAAKGGHAAVVEYLLEKGSRYAESALKAAISKRHMNIVKVFVEHRGTVGFVLQAGLFEAVKLHDNELAILLLEAHADVNTRDRETGQTPVSCAVGNTAESTKIVKTLLDNKAVPTPSDAALSEAASHHNMDVFNLLLAGGWDLTTPSRDGKTPLMWFAHHGDVAVIEQILRLMRDRIGENGP